MSSDTHFKIFLSRKKKVAKNSSVLAVSRNYLEQC